MESKEGTMSEQLERFIDRRVEKRLAELMDGQVSEEVPELAVKGVTRRETMAMAAGGVVGYGISTVVGGGENGSSGGTIDDEDGEDREEGGASAADLQRALEEQPVVRVAGEIDVTGETPITVPQNTILYGEGVYRQALDEIGGDGLRAESEGPIVELEGNDTQLFGLALVNASDDGDAIEMAGFSGRVSHTDLYATRYGINCDPDDRSTEPRINFNRVVSEGGSDAEGVGIRVNNMNDAKVINNIVAGFDVAIAINLESAIVSMNHMYTYPASSSSVGVRIDAPGVRLVNNRIEGESSEAGIQIWASERSIVSQNLVQVASGADGIAFDVGPELANSFITQNQIEGYSSDEGGGTAVNGSNVDSFYRSVVGPNAHLHFENEGLTGVTEAAGAGGTPSGNRYFTYQIVQNVDDDSIWMKAQGGMYRLA